jgi:type IV pilus assembly protein PilC
MAKLEYQVQSEGEVESGAKKSEAISPRPQGQQAGPAGGNGEAESVLKKLQSFSISLGPSRKDVLNFTNQLAVMTKSGISIDDALEAISGQCENQKFANIIMGIKKDVLGGQSLSQAIGKYPGVFGNLYVNMIAAAEVSGSLASMLEKLADYLDQEMDTRSQVRSAMVYPIIIGVMAIGVTIFLLTFVLPRFTAIFVGKEYLLPKPTKIIMALSALLRGYWFVIIPVIGGLLWGFLYSIKTPFGKFWWDKTKLTVPLMRRLCRSLYITRSLHTMGVLINAGVPILDTLAITSEISGNVHFRQMWQNVQNSVKEGHKIAFSLSGYSLLPNSVVQMIRSGEESGKLSEVMSDVSEFYARELKAVIKTVTSMIEPIMIVLMGLMVGFIAMSIILPIFKMSSVVAG